MTLEEFTSQIEEILERHKSQRVEDFDYVPDVKTITSKNITLEDWNTIVTAIENVVTNNNTISETTIALFEIFKQYPEVIFTEFKEIVQDLVNKSDISTHISHLATKAELNTQIKNLSDLKENVSNKTTTLTSSSTHKQYPSAKVVYDRIQDVREVAEGKSNSYVISYSDVVNQDTDFSTNNYYDMYGYRLENYGEVEKYILISALERPSANNDFNSKNDNLVFEDLNRYIIVESSSLFNSKDINGKVILPLEFFISKLRIGDVINIREVNIPDRWYAGNHSFGALETKIDLTALVNISDDQEINGIKNFTNGIKIGNSPITFSNNELQVVNDIVGLEGNNLGSQTQPFNKLYAKYFNDGSGTEAMLSELMPKVLEVSITDILTNQSKITTLFSEVFTMTSKQKSLAVKLDNPISIDKNYEKIIVDLSPLSQLGIDGSITFSRASNTSSKGKAYFLELPIIGISSGDIQKTSIFLNSGDGSSLTDFTVFINGYKTPLIDTDLTNYCTETEVDNKINAAIGNVLNGDF